MADIIPFPQHQVFPNPNPQEATREWLARTPDALRLVSINCFASQHKLREEHAEQLWELLTDDERKEWETAALEDLEKHFALPESWAAKADAQSLADTMAVNDMVLDDRDKYLAHLNNVASKYHIIFNLD